jgi:hypothetical protein
MSRFEPRLATTKAAGADLDDVGGDVVLAGCHPPSSKRTNNAVAGIRPSNRIETDRISVWPTGRKIFGRMISADAERKNH